MTTLLPPPSRRRVAVPVGRLARQPWPTADARWQPCATADIPGGPPAWQPCATADAGRQQVTTAAHPALHDDAVRLATLVRGLHHGTATLRRPDLLDARLRRLCDAAAPLLGDDRLLDDLRTAAGLAVHALQVRPLALATADDFTRIDRLAALPTRLAAAWEPGPTRRRDVRAAGAGGWRARRQARADRALFG